VSAELTEGDITPIQEEKKLLEMMVLVLAESRSAVEVNLKSESGAMEKNHIIMPVRYFDSMCGSANMTDIRQTRMLRLIWLRNLQIELQPNYHLDTYRMIKNEFGVLDLPAPMMQGRLIG
jgi:hypothetical protein